MKSRAIQELRSMVGALNEADELDLAELTKDRKDLLKSVFPNAKLIRAWQGVHGTIVELMNPNKRIPADALKLLARAKVFRWIEVDGPDVTIGC